MPDATSRGMSADSSPLPSPPVPLRPPRGQLVPLPTLIESEAQRKRRKQMLGVGALIAVPLLCAAGWWALRPRPVPMSQRFRTEASTQGAVVHEVRATGHVEAATMVSVGAEISGRIATVEADFNTPVKKGQVLATFDRSVMEAQLAQSKAMLSAARAAVAQARFDAEQAQRNQARVDKLFVNNATSAQEHETATTALSLADARLSAAQAQLAAQESAVEVARTNLGHAVVRAPIDGTVITRNIDPGQTVASVLQTPVLFTVAADLRTMQVVAAVDEADIGDVHVGQQATFTVNAYADRVFEGRVTEVRNSPVIVQDVVTYGSVIDVDNSELLLKPGMTASVRIRTAAEPDATRVPNGALHFTPPGEHRDGAKGAVWVLEGNSLRSVPVHPGISDGEFTAVKAGELPAGARVIVDLTAEGRKAYGVNVIQ